MSAVFVTGTDTDCGKTHVGITLALTARERGLRVRVLKPAETGCPLDDDGAPSPLDALALDRAA